MRRAPNDLYAVLGLTPRATPAQIRHAYRALLRRHHPDTRSGDTGDTRHAGEPGQPGGSADLKLQLVMAAYEVLGDPARRADYDRLCAPARPSASLHVHIHPSQPGNEDDPPIQAGPVRWHHQP